MGWEKRGKNRYYYQKVRLGNRMVSKYLGSGRAAELAMLQQQARLARGQRRQRARQDLEELRKLDEIVADVDDLARAIVTGAYLAAGYYLHHREWRKKCQK